jgi:hypothetical protein
MYLSLGTRQTDDDQHGCRSTPAPASTAWTHIVGVTEHVSAAETLLQPFDKPGQVHGGDVVVGPALSGDRTLGKLEAGDGEREEVFVTADVSDADAVALGGEIVHFEAGEALFRKLAFVGLLSLVEFERRKVVEFLGLYCWQTKGIELLIETLSRLLDVLRLALAQHCLVTRSTACISREETG